MGIWIVHAYIEITPYDLVKYEIDKTTGYLRVDRPQRSSSQPPTLYGFIPRTYCGENVKILSPKASKGDRDPDQPSNISIEKVYSSEHTIKVVAASIRDYEAEFGE